MVEPGLRNLKIKGSNPFTRMATEKWTKVTFKPKDGPFLASDALTVKRKQCVQNMPFFANFMKQVSYLEIETGRQKDRETER